MKDPIVFWFNNPPKVGKGAFNYLARNWDGRVIYVFLNDFRQERKQAKWDDGDFGGAEIITLYDKDPNKAIERIFASYPETTIHIINGFGSPISCRILPYLKKYGSRRGIFMTERPVLMGNRIERYIRGIYYHLKYRKMLINVMPVMCGVLALGQMGVDTFASYGWSRDVLFPFMYCPPLPKFDAKEYNDGLCRPLRFLYVGRFYFKTKGVDILLKAAKGLHGDFKIDFVGGYGKDAKRTIDAIKASDKLDFLGTWSADEVGRRMRYYDTVVIPTKYDGWNLLVNEAVNAGVPVIVTDGAVSHEVVEQYGCGIVVPHSNARMLQSALQRLIDNPCLIKQFGYATDNAREKISEDSVGHYLVDIVNYLIYNEGQRPLCPWHN